MIYPKASSPVTQDVLDRANARADRWMRRYDRLAGGVDAVATEYRLYEAGDISAALWALLAASAEEQ